MCGICGAYWRNPPDIDVPAVERMREALRHRGPDDRGLFVDNAHGVALAHTRLSIIDLSDAGHQPMATEDGAIVLNYNGEIYNYLDLRRELESAGCRFRSQCDTEVVLRALAVWGMRALDRFCGMFAFAAWYSAERRLLLARDPIGIKPLYYRISSSGFEFASEIRAFLRAGNEKNAIDEAALRQYLELGYIADERRTAVAGIAKLPPGTYLEVRNGVASEPVGYWRPPSEGAEVSTAELYDTLAGAVREHVHADVPVGILLSGGLDSSLIAAIAARSGPVTTLTMGFAESALDERPHGRLVAEHIGSTHHELLLTPGEIREQIPAGIDAIDDLFADWGVVTTRLLYGKARESGLKVVLVGEGSDEIFGGYPQFAESLRGGPAELQILRLFRRLSGRRHARGYPQFRRLMKSYLSESDGDLFLAIRLYELRNQLPNNYVMKVDNASMSVSVEARVPYLDRRVVELALRMPRAQLLAHGENKYLLREMARRFELLPEEVLSRPKLGGSIAAGWMDDSAPFRAFARATILESGPWIDAVGMRNAMTRYFDRSEYGYPFPRGISIFSNLAWKLLLLGLWLQAKGISVER